MELLPLVRSMALSAANPGDLVKVYIDGYALGIVADLNGKRYILFLSYFGEHHTRAPGHWLFEDDKEEMIVLSYGKEYAFHVAHQGRAMTLQGVTYNGGLLITDSLTAMRVAAFYENPPGHYGTSLYYNIKTGLLADKFISTELPVMMLDWEIRLNSATASEPPIFSYATPL